MQELWKGVVGMTVYICDDFHLGLIGLSSYNMGVSKIDLETAKKVVRYFTAVNCIKDEVKTRVLSRLLGVDIPPASINQSLTAGATVLVFRIRNGFENLNEEEVEKLDYEFHLIYVSGVLRPCYSLDRILNGIRALGGVVRPAEEDSEPINLDDWDGLDDVWVETVAGRFTVTPYTQLHGDDVIWLTDLPILDM